MKRIMAKALMRLANDVAKETGHSIILYYSDKNGGDGWMGLKIVQPGNTMEKAIDFGEMKHEDCRSTILKYRDSVRFVHAQRSFISTSCPPPPPSKPKWNLTREQFKTIISECSVMLLGKLINALHDEIRMGYETGKPYNLQGYQAITIRKYAQVYNAYGKFRDRQVVGNVRSTLLSYYTLIATSVMRKYEEDNEMVFPPKYNAIA